MKRLVLAVAVLGLMACKKPQQTPAADTTATPVAAPAPAMGDTMHMPGDTSKMMSGDTSKMD